MLSPLLILLLLALCGFIAYLGDLLGRRLGKRRLSIFGLRPKHTAILLTIVTGVVIAGVTFGAAMLMLPGFRQMVLEGERLAEQNARLAADTRNLTIQNEQQARRNEELQLEAGRRATENAALRTANQRLGQTNQALEQVTGRLRSEGDALRSTNRGLQGENRRLQAEGRRLSSSAERLRRVLREYEALARGYKEEKYLFRREEQIAWDFILPGAPPAETLRELVRAQLYRSAVEARSRLTNRRVEPTIELAAPTSYPGGRPLSRAAITDWVVRELLSLRGKPVFLRVVADENCVEGRPIRVRFDWFINEFVFRKGELIAEETLDGRDPDELIFVQILSFLQQQVRQSAEAPPRSMVPSSRGLGEINWLPVLQAWEQLRAVEGPVVLRARARLDIRRAGPLYLDLEVQAVETAFGTPR